MNAEFFTRLHAFEDALGVSVISIKKANKE